MNRNKLGQVIAKHLTDHSSLYIFTSVLMVMGIVFGTLTVNSLSFNQHTDLFKYFQQFLKEMQTESFIDQDYAYYQYFLQNLLYIGAIWVLGLSIIGLPLILIMVFLKGVFVGFTVGFLVYHLGWQGFAFSLVSVLPKNLIVVPILIVISVISISFSMKLIHHFFGNRYHVKPNIGRYIVSIIGAGVFLLLVSFIDTFISPVLMKWMI